jgi:hypothetical protein
MTNGVCCVLDGRWAYAEVPRVDDQFFEDHVIDKEQLWFPEDESDWTVAGSAIHVANPYGLLRSPWNWNPSPYVTRYNAVHGIANISGINGIIRDFYSGVGCSDFQSFISNQVKGQPLYNFLHFAEDQVHGEIHFTFGGAGGDYANEQVRASGSAMFLFN